MQDNINEKTEALKNLHTIKINKKTQLKNIYSAVREIYTEF